MFIGKWRSRTDSPFGFEWVQSLRILGAHFGNSGRPLDHENFDPMLGKLQKVLDLWSSRDLSFIGRSLILNCLGASKFWYLARVLPVPPWVSKRFNQLARRFVCGSRGQPLTKPTMTRISKVGGLGVVDFDIKCQALKASFCFQLVFSKSLPDWHFTGNFYLARSLGSLCEW